MRPTACRPVPTLAFAILAALAAPRAIAQVQTETASWGWWETTDYQYDGQHNDAYETHVTGTFGGQTLFDLTFHRSIVDADVVAALRAQTAPRGFAVGGAPAVLTWGELEFVDGWEEMLDSFTEVSYTTTTTETTEQVTSGDAPDNVLYVGDRGYCYDAGVSGPTNFGDASGRFATCDYGEEFTVEAGTVNTNTHTTTTVTTVERWFTQEDWLNIGFFRIAAEATLIGGVHTATQSAAFDVGTAFRRQLLSAAPPSPERFRAWLGAHGGGHARDAAHGIAGDRRDWRGTRGGVEFGLPAGFRVGIAGDRSSADVDAVAFPESARFDLVQVGLHARWEGVHGYVAGAATRGRGDVSTRHGDASLGGVAEADYDLDVDVLALEAGWRARFGPLELAPMVGVERIRVRSDGFAETGGIALVAPAHTSERDAAWAGVEAARTWTFGGGRALRLGGRIALVEFLSGDARVLPVALASDPATPLAIAGLADDARTTTAALAATFAFGPHLSLRLEGERDWREDDTGDRFAAALRVDW
jgi:hypothetical protein